jgi:hypothetical protein
MRRVDLNKIKIKLASFIPANMTYWIFIYHTSKISTAKSFANTPIPDIKVMDVIKELELQGNIR